MTCIRRISFTTADPVRLVTFYQQAFGFILVETSHHTGPIFSELMGIHDAEARGLRLRLGNQVLELLGFTRPGESYPRASSSNDLRFQHIAIVVSDMAAAFDRLRTCPGWSPISTAGPQHLPASSGGVTAFKFRDPEGHPLELLAFPSQNVPPSWQPSPSRGGPYLGIDHSAIVVTSTASSVDFYTGLLGFEVRSGSLNSGPEQARLDHVPHPVVEVTSLFGRSPAPPHLELLCYRSEAPPKGPVALSSNDIAATRLILELDDLPQLITRLEAAGVPFISKRMVRFEDDRPAALVRDPDGHALLLVARNSGSIE